jgi:hypothetical protein
MIRRLIAVAVLSVTLFGCGSEESHGSTTSEAAELEAMYNRDEKVFGADIAAVSEPDEAGVTTITLINATETQLQKARSRWSHVTFESLGGGFDMSSPTLP